MSELAAELAATANEPVAETPDSVLDTVFDAEPDASPQPSGDPDPAPEPVAATQQPQTPEPPNVGVKGEPPRERWDSILENARKKARDEALDAHKDALEVVRQLQADPAGTIAQLLEEGSIDPRFSEQLTSRAAAILAARDKTAKANAEPEPDLQTADGALVYSADQLRKWHQWNQTQTEDKLTKQFAPLQQLQQRFEQHQQQVKATEEIAQAVSARWAQWESMPFLKENMDAIKTRQGEIYAEIEAQGQQGLRRFDPKDAPFEALQRAYAEVVSTQAVPKLRSAQTGQFIADAARKRAGSSSDPAAQAPAQPRKPRTVDEALDQVFSGIA